MGDKTEILPSFENILNCSDEKKAAKSLELFKLVKTTNKLNDLIIKIHSKTSQVTKQQIIQMKAPQTHKNYNNKSQVFDTVLNSNLETTEINPKQWQ